MSFQKSILVIDDDLEIRSVLRDILEWEGYSVATATNGREGLEWISVSGKPHLILLDVEMPVMDGRAFLHTVQADADFASIPVIVISANAEPKEIHGASAFIRKPMAIEPLLALVSRSLG
jgi:CheY-like chemotaxis protein